MEIKEIIKTLKTTIDFESRKSKHKSYIIEQIYDLRQEIVYLVLKGHRENDLPLDDLKRKAMLIQKYSRRLRLLHA